MILVEDSADSRSPVRDASPHFPVFPEFQGASYQKRYDLLCQRLVQEQLYTAASVLTTARPVAKTGQYQELSALTSLKTLITTLAGHIAAEAATRCGPDRLGTQVSTADGNQVRDRRELTHMRSNSRPPTYLLPQCCVDHERTHLTIVRVQ